MVKEDIDSVVTGAQTLSSLGAEGFVLFSILVVAVMFTLLLSAVVFIYKSSRKQHVANENRIADLTARVVATEARASANSQLHKDCEQRLHQAISKLEVCTDKLIAAGKVV